MKIERLSNNCYKIPRSGNMKVDALIFINDFLFNTFLESEAIKQLADSASLPGVYKYVVGMPDIHSGFGLPIGGVMAMDAEKGLISAGAVGMDINCGVRLLRTNLKVKDLKEKHLKGMMKEISSRVPTGIGKTSKHQSAIKKHFKQVVEKGVPALTPLGFVREEDPMYIEEGGGFHGANLEKVSKKALERGNQLSTIGGGNHFIELGRVAEIYDEETAFLFGLVKGNLSILIHTGSRGFGHQICTDYSRVMEGAAKKYNLDLPSKGLASVPLNSQEGRDYYSAMAAAVNFAFANRQMITFDVRKALSSYFNCNDKELDLGIVYDVAHNIAKLERFEGKNLLIHRKGATRALPPGHPNNPQAYISTGHPVLIPGSMGTSSFVVVAEPPVESTFYSINHGAGRVMSRRSAKKQITVEDFQEQVKHVLYFGDRDKDLLDEAPRAYKDIDAVINTMVELGMIRKVARLFPLAVVKGEGREG